MQEKAPIGFQCNALTELIDSRGRLVYRFFTRETPFWPEYDALRMKWCGEHRDAWTPPGLREGEVHWWNIFFLKYQEVKNGSSK